MLWFWNEATQLKSERCLGSISSPNLMQVASPTLRNRFPEMNHENRAVIIDWSLNNSACIAWLTLHALVQLGTQRPLNCEKALLVKPKAADSAQISIFKSQYSATDCLSSLISGTDSDQEGFYITFCFIWITNASVIHINSTEEVRHEQVNWKMRNLPLYKDKCFRLLDASNDISFTVTFSFGVDYVQRWGRPSTAAQRATPT